MSPLVNRHSAVPLPPGPAESLDLFSEKNTLSQGPDIMGIMTTTATIHIVKALTPQLGEKTAIDLVEYIESAHTEKLATKTDVQELRAETKTDIQELRAETKAGLQEVRAEIQELRAETKADIQELRAEMKADIQELRAEMKADIQELRAEMKTGFLAVDNRLLSSENRLLWKLLGGTGIMLGILAALLRYLLR